MTDEKRPQEQLMGKAPDEQVYAAPLERADCGAADSGRFVVASEVPAIFSNQDLDEGIVAAKSRHFGCGARCHPPRWRITSCPVVSVMCDAATMAAVAAMHRAFA